MSSVARKLFRNIVSLAEITGELVQRFSSASIHRFEAFANGSNRFEALTPHSKHLFGREMGTAVCELLSYELVERLQIIFASTAMMNSLLENKPLDKRNTPVLAESNQLRCQRGSKHCEYGIAPYDIVMPASLIDDLRALVVSEGVIDRGHEVADVHRIIFGARRDRVA